MSGGKPPNQAEKEMQAKTHKHTRVCFHIGNKKKKEDTPRKQPFD